VPLKHKWEELAPAIAEISGNVRQIEPRQIEDLLWWQRFLRGRARHNREFIRQVDDALARPLLVCRVQGDATPSNIFRSGKRILICDWEYGSPSGPRRTDEISYYLAANHYQCLLRPMTMLAACVRRFAPDRDRDAIGELAAGIAFLCGRNDPRALKLAACWQFVTPARVLGREAPIGATSSTRRLSLESRP
jgi:hypothetical protein